MIIFLIKLDIFIGISKSYNLFRDDSLFWVTSFYEIENNLSSSLHKAVLVSDTGMPFTLPTVSIDFVYIYFNF